MPMDDSRKPSGPVDTQSVRRTAPPAPHTDKQERTPGRSMKWSCGLALVALSSRGKYSVQRDRLREAWFASRVRRTPRATCSMHVLVTTQDSVLACHKRTNTPCTW